MGLVLSESSLRQSLMINSVLINGFVIQSRGWCECFELRIVVPTSHDGLI
jgi:hypothetical protein